MTTPQFVDMSVFNGTLIDWQTYKNWSSSVDGISRVAIRASYGGYQDAYFNAHRAGALSVGIDEIIYYHYAYPQFNTAQDEVKWSQAVIGDIRSSDWIMLDYEEDKPTSTSLWALDWLTLQQVRYGSKVGIYSYPDFIAHHLQDNRLASFPLWYANWQYTPDERPSPPAPWTSYKWIQYTDKATNIPGIPGTVDVDIFVRKESQMLSTNDPFVAQYYTIVASDRWHCNATNQDIAYAILDFYRYSNGILRLPVSGEIAYPGGQAGQVYQVFEGGIVVYGRTDIQGGATYSNCELLMRTDPINEQLLSTPGGWTIPQKIIDDVKQLMKDVGL